MPNHFKERLTSGPPQIGSFASVCAPATAEAMACHGLDFVMVDLEHAPNDISTLVMLLAATEAGGAEPIVRAPWNDAVWLKRILDAGGRSIMVPFIQTAEEAARAVAAVRYPPQGVRGVAAMTRASRYGARPDYMKVANEETCVIMQIETKEALSRIDEIAAVPGVDAIFFGPSDLAASLGLIGNPLHADVQGQIAQGFAAGKRIGAKVGVLGSTPEQCAAFVKQGFDFVILATDLGIFVRQLKTDIGVMEASSGWTRRS
ncbi:HpcH/HpaI aldolase/citrate lyase family protein [Bradyrhizobium sp. WSM2793]|uniref:HpcH/HpaI aldolase family protein n=1 Tax=Bradyrhizobium sp. WSM2793 TaxID=1038866 RepID=UPI0003A09C6B|nr:aldolase/citrate lyase family protein [Bradyrhizobium sp. WSM2793]